VAALAKVAVMAAPLAAVAASTPRLDKFIVPPRIDRAQPVCTAHCRTTLSSLQRYTSEDV
jgi:hypothetical protein